MGSETAVRLRWRESLGIMIAVFSAVALALVIWQLSRLGGEPVDRNTVDRERMAVAMSGRIVIALQALFAYQREVVLSNDPAALPRLRHSAEIELAGIVRDFSTGDAVSVAPDDLRVRRIWSTWKKAAAVTPGPDADASVRAVVVALEQAMTGMEDASNLTYDSSMVGQNLADIRIVESPLAMAGIARAQTLADLAVKNNAMTLGQRIAAANSISSIRNTTDLSIDNVSILPQRLRALIPERAAEVEQLSISADALYQQGSEYADLISRDILLKNAPATTAASIDDASEKLMQRVRGAFDLFGAALDESLVRRGELQGTRNADVYLLFIFGGMLLVGVMTALAQFVASRDRRKLHEAQRESSRLAAELARQRAEKALRLSKAQFRAVYDGAAVGIAIVNRAGLLVDANHVFRRMFGDSVATALEGHEEELIEVLKGERETFEFEQHLSSTVGAEIWTDVTVSIVNGPEDTPLYAMCMFRDKTELKRSEHRMLHDKMHDALTGLPNRQLFEQHLRRRFDEAGALLDSFFAVLFVDLEHFRDVNESLGHHAGDVVLTQVAQRLSTSVDNRDVVGRLGSDEFAILVQSLGDTLHVESIARRTLNNLSKSISVGSKAIYLGASVGIAIGSSGYERAEDVMRDAEIAMQHAKSSGGARYAVFDSKMRARAQKRLELTTDLRLAIERREFRLVYQPIVNIYDNRPVGCEALIRWDHPSEGVLNPSEFIPLAEQSGLATPIGRYVMQTAAEQLAAWRRNRGGDIDFTMHVNVSAAELSDPDFERNLIQVVERNGLSPSDFMIEITENVVLDTGTRANLTLERVRERGFRICIDDFGTGYSSLRYLQQFSVDCIKIDRSFVAGTDGDLASEPIVRTLMTLAEAFDVTVVAEGVESTRQRELLRSAGCRFVQGYLYAQALSPAELINRYPEVLARAPRSASA